MPDVEDLAACAEYKAKFDTAIKWVYSWNGRVAKALRKEIDEREGMPIGRMALVDAHAWEYPVQIADELPQFGQNMIALKLSCETDPGRVLDILLEAMPEQENEIREHWAVTTEVNKSKVAAWIKAHDATDPTCARLRELRKKKMELGVLDG